MQSRLIDACGFWAMGVFAMFHFSEYTENSFGQHHEYLFNLIPPGAQGIHENILAPRGSAKSTIIAKIYPLHCIYYKDAYRTLGLPTINFILLVANTASLSELHTWSIGRKISGHTPFNHLVGQDRWGIETLLTANNTMIQTSSRGGQVRGKLFDHYRPDLIICDDLDDAEKVNNAELRAKDKLWFDSDLLACGRPDGKTNIINIDTVKHEESNSNLLQQRTGWGNKLFRAIPNIPDLWHPTAEDLWAEWQRLYSDLNLTPRERLEKSNAYFAEHEEAMMQDVEHLWEENITYLRLRQKICDDGYFPVLREYQNSTRDPSRALFDMDTALRFEVVAEGFKRSDKILVTWQEMTGCTIFLDWAGGKDVKENAFAAVVAVIWVRLPGTRDEQKQSIMDGVHGYVYRADVRRIGIDQQITACVDMYNLVKSEIKTRNFRIRLGIEGFVQDTWQAQRDVAQRAFQAEKDKQNVQDLSIEWLTRQINKYDRIDSLQPLILNGWLIFNQDLPNEFYKQMYQYPTGDFLDAPDALEGACQLRISRFETERQRQRQASRERRETWKVEV